MIEIKSALHDGFVAIRHRGTVTNREFADLGWKVAASSSDRALPLCLDWLEIQHWTFSSVNADTLAAWRNAARTINCLAIVHGHRLDRQAAWLAAVLREEGVTVRSWRPQQAAAAEAWLCACQRPLNSDSTPRLPS